jgi:hypothetical protein
MRSQGRVRDSVCGKAERVSMRQVVMKWHENGLKSKARDEPELILVTPPFHDQISLTLLLLTHLLFILTLVSHSHYISYTPSYSVQFIFALEIECKLF